MSRPATQRLLTHWRHHPFQTVRPFFCQVEAVETAIWLTEVARRERRYDRFRATPARGERAGQPGTVPHRPEDGDRQRQNHGDGHADGVADGQRRPHAGEQPLQPRLPDRHARHHHQGPAAGAAAQRPGQLLSRPRAGAGGPAAATSTAPRSSSPTTTPSSRARRWRSARPAARCFRAGMHRPTRSRTTARCCTGSPTTCWGSRASSSSMTKRITAIGRSPTAMKRNGR